MMKVRCPSELVRSRHLLFHRRRYRWVNSEKHFERRIFKLHGIQALSNHSVLVQILYWTAYGRVNEISIDPCPRISN